MGEYWLPFRPAADSSNTILAAASDATFDLGRSGLVDMGDQGGEWQWYLPPIATVQYTRHDPTLRMAVNPMCPRDSRGSVRATDGTRSSKTHQPCPRSMISGSFDKAIMSLHTETPPPDISAAQRLDRRAPTAAITLMHLGIGLVSLKN